MCVNRVFLTAVKEDQLRGLSVTLASVTLKVACLLGFDWTVKSPQWQFYNVKQC